MIQLRELIGFPNLDWHIQNKRSLSENVYRYSSESFLSLFSEARKALLEGAISLSQEDERLIRETDIGLYGEYDGFKVPLDIPMEEDMGTIECEKCSHSWELDPSDNRATLCHKCGYDSNLDSYDIPALEAWKSMNEKNYRGGEVALNKPMLDEIEDALGIYNDNEGNSAQIELGPNGYLAIVSGEYDYQIGPTKTIEELIKKLANNGFKNKIFEAKYQGKEVALNKPKRGGSKKFYVYTKNPKTGKVIKVSFGAEGGGQNLAVKFKEPGARASFAARHKCSTRKDKTKASYWSCRLPRYWKQLGGDKNYSGFW